MHPPREIQESTRSPSTTGELAIDVRSGALNIKLILAFLLLIVLAGGLFLFSLDQLESILRGMPSILSMPAALVLLLGSIALIVEFFFGFRTGLKEMHDKR